MVVGVEWANTRHFIYVCLKAFVIGSDVSRNYPPHLFTSGTGWTEQFQPVSIYWDQQPIAD